MNVTFAGSHCLIGWRRRLRVRSGGPSFQFQNTVDGVIEPMFFTSL